MSEPVPSVQQILGLPSDIPALGKVWKFGPPNQNAKAILEELFAADAVADTIKLERVMPAGTYQRHYKKFLTRLDAGEYATGGEGWLAKLTSPIGQQLFLLSLFRVNHPDMTMDMLLKVAAEAGQELEAALVRQVPGFFDVAFPNLSPEHRELIASTFRQAVVSRQPSPSAESLPNGTAA